MKERLIIIGLLAVLLTPVNIFSQNIKAEKYLKAAYYNEGIQEYESILNKELNKQKRVEIIKRLAVAYYNDNNYLKVVDLINELLTFGGELDSSQNYIYAQSLRSNEKYNDAAEVLKVIKADKLIHKYCIWPKENIRFNNEYNIAPTLVGQSRKYFGLAATGQGKVFYSKKNEEENNTGGYSLRAGQIIDNKTLIDEGFLFNHKTSKYETTPFYNLSTNELFYSANYLDEKYYIATSGEENKVNQHNIYVAKIENGEVISTESLPINNINYSCSFPFLYQDSVLFYSSNNPVSGSNMDIYYVTRNKEGNWSEPKVLEGPNTFENDIYPFVHKGNFYFSSKGREGYGGMDIYQGKLINKKGDYQVANIKNLGKPINSSMDDFGLMFINEYQGFFSTNRNLTHDEVWSVKFLELQKISGIYQVNNLPQENVKVSVLQLNDEGYWEEVSQALTNDNGAWELEVDSNKVQKIVFQEKGINTHEFVLKADDQPFREKMIHALSQLNRINKEPSFNDTYLTENIFNGELQVVSEKGIITTIDLSKEKGVFSGKGIPINKEEKGTIYINEETDEIFSFNGKNWEKVESITKNKIQLKNDLAKLMWMKNNIENITNEKVEIMYELNTREIPTQKSLMLSVPGYFDYKSDKLRKRHKEILKIVSKEMANKPSIKTELIGYTDGISTEDYNNILSTKRAVASLKYLRGKGVSMNQIYFTGVGEEKSSHLDDKNEKDKKEYATYRKVQIKVW